MTFIAVLIFTCMIIKYRQETSCTLLLLLLLLLLLAINTTRIAINVKTANGRVDKCLHIKRLFDLQNNKLLKNSSTAQKVPSALSVLNRRRHIFQQRYQHICILSGLITWSRILCTPSKHHYQRRKRYNPIFLSIIKIRFINTANCRLVCVIYIGQVTVPD